LKVGDCSDIDGRFAEHPIVEESLMPAPAPTELLAEDIRDLRETNHRMAARLDSLETAVRDLGRDLGNFRAEVASEIGGLRAEVADKLGAINDNLGRFQSRTETSLRIAGWAITILTPVVLSLLGGAFWITWHVAKLDSRVERVESRLPNEPPAIPTAATEASRHQEGR
jgi:hypothetical protein